MPYFLQISVTPVLVVSCSFMMANFSFAVRYFRAVTDDTSEVSFMSAIRPFVYATAVSIIVLSVCVKSPSNKKAGQEDFRTTSFPLKLRNGNSVFGGTTEDKTHGAVYFVDAFGAKVSRNTLPDEGECTPYAQSEDGVVAIACSKTGAIHFFHERGIKIATYQSTGPFLNVVKKGRDRFVVFNESRITTLTSDGVEEKVVKLPYVVGNYPSPVQFPDGTSALFIDASSTRGFLLTVDGDGNEVGRNPLFKSYRPWGWPTRILDGKIMTVPMKDSDGNTCLLLLDASAKLLLKAEPAVQDVYNAAEPVLVRAETATEDGLIAAPFNAYDHGVVKFINYRTH